jgi:hypothetical protein
MTTKSVFLSSVLSLSSVASSVARADTADTPINESTDIQTPPVVVVNGTTALVCNPDDPNDCFDPAGDFDDTIFSVNVNYQLKPKTTRFQYIKCVIGANLVRSQCDSAFGAIHGLAGYATGGASTVATYIAGVGLVSCLQACYDLYTAQYNSCRIDHGLPPVNNPL